MTADVTDRASLEAALGACVSELGRVDVLVNCAACTKRTPTLDLGEEEWHRILDTNLTGTLRACQVFGRHMLERGSGRIVNIASLASSVALLEVAAYNASKAAVVALTKSLALEWGPRGVNVNAIAPGVFRTPLNQELIDGTEQGARVRRPDAPEAVRADGRAAGGLRPPRVGRLQLHQRRGHRRRRRLPRGGSPELKVESVSVRDVRFPTSRERDGSDS